jgi:uncharacterized spore protein YtfJ
MEINDTVSAVLSEIKKVTSSEAVVGKPIKVGDTVVIPVSRLRFGFAVGGGDVTANQSGREGSVGSGAAGGGVSVEPQAFIFVDAAGIAHLLSMRDSAEAPIVKAIQLVPEVLEKMVRTGADVFGKSAGAAETPGEVEPASEA